MIYKKRNLVVYLENFAVNMCALWYFILLKMINLVCEGVFPEASRQPRAAEGITEEQVPVVGFDCSGATCHPRLTSTHRPLLPSETPSLWCSEDRSMSRSGGKAGMLNFAWILFEVSGDKKGSSPMFSCVHCEEEDEATYSWLGYDIRWV